MSKSTKTRTLWVEEFDHAYLVHNTNVVDVARQALFEHLGRKKWNTIKRMPARPFHTELGTGSGHSCVALYFAIGPGAPHKYKP